MPRLKKQVFEPEAVDPRHVVVLGQVIEKRVDGVLLGNLHLHDIPTPLLVEIGHACALATLKVIGWPEDKAAILGQHVRDQLQRDLVKLQEDTEASESAWQTVGKSELDDDIPF